MGKKKTIVKSILCLGLIVHSVSVQANSWLFGLEVGHSSRSYTLNATNVNADQATSAATDIPFEATMALFSEDFSDDGAVLGALMGYEWDTHPSNLVASLEFIVTWGDISKTHGLQYTDNLELGTQLIGQAKFNRNAQFELSARLGIKGPRLWTPYLRLGGVASNDELTYALNLSYGNFLQTDHMSQKDRAWGWLAGVGVELPLFADSILPMLRSSVVRFEYNYTRFERIKMEDTSPPYIGEYSTRPVTHLFKAALVFKHGPATR